MNQLPGGHSGSNNSGGDPEMKGSASLSINRYNMIFAQTIQNNRDLQDKSLTMKNSSENMSVNDPGDGSNNQVMRRVPSNSSYLNKISHTNINVNLALEQRKKPGETIKPPKSGLPLGVNYPLSSGSGSTASQNIY